MAVLDGLKPEKVFRYFEEICSMPHGSGDTWTISNYLVKFALDHSLKCIQDKLGNVVIFKPGSVGYENSKTVMLQGHMDMVCEKEADSQIDFSKDGLELLLEDNVIRANQTTLGGDDGIAVAYALAILDDDTIKHPPIEAVFTVDEEIGMLGASYIDCSMLQASYMLNLDSEDEGELLVSCAGGATSVISLPVQYETKEQDGDWYKIEIQHAVGGHSGMEIIRQGANASKVLGRVLYGLSNLVDFNLASIDGGCKDNAIPRSAKAIIRIATEKKLLLEQEIEKWNALIKEEYRVTDPEITVSMEAWDASKHGNRFCVTKEDTKRILHILKILPNGVMEMSPNMEGMVQTSLNLGIMETKQEDACVRFSFCVRSSVNSKKEELKDTLRCIAESFMAKYDEHGDYPAWEYKKESVLRDTMADIYKELYGKAAKVVSIHAGVECGLFAGKMPGLDCVSIGPDMLDIHTPKERLMVDSVVRTWNYILAILEKLQ